MEYADQITLVEVLDYRWWPPSNRELQPTGEAPAAEFWRSASEGAPMADGPRIDELRRLGLSEPVIRTAGGEVVHDALWSVCLPLPPGVAEPPAPSGTRFVPLWQFAGGVTGAVVREDRTEFVDYAIDRPQDGFEFVAGTEQGLLAYVLSHVVDEQLAGAAEAIGFRFLAELRVASDIEGLRSLIGRIDSQCESVGRAEPLSWPTDLNQNENP